MSEQARSSGSSVETERGKITAMRAVMGILRPSRGTISWRGHSVTGTDRLRFGYMPEERGLYPQMRVLDQVAYFGQLHGLDRATARDRAQRRLDVLELSGRERDKVVALSHGNQQRVQLAVALVHDPDLLVLDEPFAGLDPAAAEVLSQILLTRAEAGTAVLFSSHQLDLVERLCGRVVILDRAASWRPEHSPTCWRASRGIHGSWSRGRPGGPPA